MLRAERQAEILSMLTEAGSRIVSISDLSQTLCVSAMTIRRDLETLEEQGLVRRVRGGAMHAESPLLFELSFRDRAREHHEQKAAIGREAAKLVKDGQVIILDAGTTTLEVSRHIQARKVTAVTSALPVAIELAAHEEVSAILLGGNLKAPELCTVGPMTTESLSHLAADILFLSASGFSPERGVSDPDLREAEVKQAMMRAARRVVLVADSSKYEAVTFALVAPMGEVGVLVTDTGLPQAGKAAIEALGVEVVLAELGSDGR